MASPRFRAGGLHYIQFQEKSTAFRRSKASAALRYSSQHGDDFCNVPHGSRKTRNDAVDPSNSG